MPSAKFDVTELGRFTIPPISQQQLRVVGAGIVETITRRVADFRTALDQPAEPYSTRGPIYIPVTGTGTVLRGLKGVSDGTKEERRETLRKLRALPAERRKVFEERRTKTSLGGREVFTHRDIAKLRKSGVISGGRGVRGSTPLGQVTPSGKSVKFANYSDYKKALGKTGKRDLELSGRMLGALSIVEMTATSVTVGFTRDAEEAIAQGNQLRDTWFGLSPSDRAFLFRLLGIQPA